LTKISITFDYKSQTTWKETYVNDIQSLQLNREIIMVCGKWKKYMNDDLTDTDS